MPLPEPHAALAAAHMLGLGDAERPRFVLACEQYWTPKLADPKETAAARVDRMRVGIMIATAEAQYAQLIDPSSLPRFYLDSLHATIGSLLPGEVWALGGRTGNGKTTLLLNWLNQLLIAKVPFFLAPLEQGVFNILRKLACLRAAISWTEYSHGQVTAEDKRRVHDAMEEIRAELLAIGCQMAAERRLTPGIVKQWLRQCTDDGIPLLIVDHMHRLDEGNEHDMLGEILRRTKDWCEREELTAFYTGQLSREDTSRIAQFKPPRLSDFRGSAVIEHECDGVIGIWRPMRDVRTVKELREYENNNKELRELLVPHRMAYIVLKARNSDGAFLAQGSFHVERGVIRDLEPEELAADARAKLPTVAPSRRRSGRDAAAEPREEQSPLFPGDAYEGPEPLQPF